MSTSYSVSLCYGILFDKDDLTTSIPHPLYGKFKFDPDTGKKVSEFKTKEHEQEQKVSQFYIGFCIW